ncbi:GerAB/ArcD/ProY family transporter [Clostridium sp. FAM 1755]|uniref:GerAB/ArcD/ProY family transporter n=1 Tax=Clostridium caseinilyticum TaxID=3350403 RepID=UPI0038F62F45
MVNNEEDFLTEHQLTILLIGCMIGIGILSLPNAAIKIAKQDGWISVLLGAIYPLYITFMAIYIRKNYPKEDILNISKKIYGNILGNIFNLIFLSFFFIISTDLAAEINNILKVYMIYSLNFWNLSSLLFLFVAYASYGGTKVIAKINEILFYGTFIVFLIPFFSLKNVNITNMQPLLGSGIKNVVKGIRGTFISYSGFEILFIFYPFIDENVKIKKPAFKSILFTTILYTLYTMLTLLYLGINTSQKFLWPVITITTSIIMPIINSFKYIFLSLWTMTMFKCISIYYFTFTYGLNKIFKKISRENWIILFYPIMVIGSNLYGSPTLRQGLIEKMFNYYIPYNIVFISITALLIALKKCNKN